MREKRSCFVMMPYSNQMDRIFQEAIIPALKSVTAGDVLALRADMTTVDKPVLARIVAAIETADICIVDLTGNNRNVMFELGLAWARRKPIVVITQSLETIPSSLSGTRVLTYSPSRLDDLIPILSTAVDALLLSHERRSKLSETGFSADLLHESQLIEQFAASARYTLSAVVG